MYVYIYIYLYHPYIEFVLNMSQPSVFLMEPWTHQLRMARHAEAKLETANTAERREVFDALLPKVLPCSWKNGVKNHGKNHGKNHRL